MPRPWGGRAAASARPARRRIGRIGWAGAPPAALWLALTFVPPHAAAQSQPSAPAPSADAAPSEQAPISLLPAPADTTQATEDGSQGPDAAPGGRQPAIEVQPLSAPAADSVGLLTSDQGGLGVDLWHGTKRARLEALLPLLPAGTGSPAAADLTWRLLASQASVPAGAPDAQSLLALRLERLYAMGRTKAVSALLERAGRGAQRDDFAEPGANAALVGGDVQGACATADGMRKKSGAAFWLEMSAFCAAERHDSAAVQLNLDLLQDGGGKIDQTYLDLLQALSAPASDAKPKDAKAKAPKSRRVRKTASGKITTPGQLTPLLYAMYGAAGITPPEAAVAHASLPVLRAIVGDDKAAPDLRLAAAERCAAAGALDPAALAHIYAAMKFDDGAFHDPVAASAKLPPATGDALLFQAIGRSSDAGAKRAMLRAALTRAADQRQFLLAARLYAPGIAAMTPDPAQPGFADDAGRVLLAAGQPDQAFAWYVLAQHAAGQGDADAKAAVADLWPIFALSQPQSRFPVRAQDVVDWLRDAPAAKGDQGVLVLALLEALGRPVPDAAWWAAFARRDAVATPTHLTLSRLTEAAAAGNRVGETVLESLILIGPDIAAAPPADLADAIAALRAVDQEPAARGIARDAALARRG